MKLFSNIPNIIHNDMIYFEDMILEVYMKINPDSNPSIIKMQIEIF